jgi:hypothetical protein
MTSEIIAAIISSAVAIVAPIITLVFKNNYDRRIWETITGRRKAIIGKWVGSITQTIENIPTSFNLEITFTADKKIVKGDASFISPLTSRTIKLKFVGGFLFERFIKFDYKNPDESVIQFGNAILDLSADGKTLIGKFVGFGSITNQIVSGEVTLNLVA